MKRTLALLGAFLAMSAAQAQVSGAATAQQSATGTSAASIASGAVVVQSFGAPELAEKHVVNEQTGTATLKTTGNAIAPGIYNSSGLYMCGGAVTGAVGAVGVAVSGGASIELKNCLGQHRLDKAAARANAAVKASMDPALPSTVRVKFEAQAEAFTKLWDAEYCALDGGAEAYAKAGMECPDERKQKVEAGRVAAVLNQQPAVDPFVAASGRQFPSGFASK